MASGKLGHVIDEDGAPVPVGADHDVVTLGQYRFGREALPELARLVTAATQAAAENGQRGRGGLW